MGGASADCTAIRREAAQQHLVLGQVKVAEKSNEISVIPKPLERLAIAALGCQREIAQKAAENRAGYVLAPKGNRWSLRYDVELFVTEHRAAGGEGTRISRDQTMDGDRGRIERETRLRITSLALPASLLAPIVPQPACAPPSTWPRPSSGWHPATRRSGSSDRPPDGMTASSPASSRGSDVHPGPLFAEAILFSRPPASATRSVAGSRVVAVPCAPPLAPRLHPRRPGNATSRQGGSAPPMQALIGIDIDSIAAAEIRHAGLLCTAPRDPQPVASGGPA